MKRLIRKILPNSLRPTAVFEKYAREVTEGGTRVVHGPFKGLRLGSKSYHSSIYNKLLGIYEKELHDAVEKIIAFKPALIVDVGAAEGFYACGLAARCPESTKHIAFEGDFRFRFALRANLERNGLMDRVEVRGFCDPAALQGVLLAHRTGGAVVICDAEGIEVELLDPRLVPAIASSTVLVEVHDQIVPGAGDFLKQVLDSTHRIEHIASVPRGAKDLLVIGAPQRVQTLPKSTIRYFVEERPDPQYWLLAIPKGRSG
jgi:hypothetical protein